MSLPRPGRCAWLVVACLAALLATGCGSSNAGSGGDASTTEDDAAEVAEPDEPAKTVEESEVEDGDVEATSIELVEVDDSGVTGVARVSSGAGTTSLQVEVELEGHDATHGIEARPGSCAEAAESSDGGLLGDATSFTLKDVADGTMQDEVEVRSDLVSEGAYALLVYAGPDVDGDVAACGEVTVD